MGERIMAIYLPTLIWRNQNSTLYNLHSTLHTLQSTQSLSKLLFWTLNAEIIDDNETEDIEKYWWRGKPKYK